MKEFIVEMHRTKSGTAWGEEKGELVRCKDCIHRPTKIEEDDEDIIVFPEDSICPCQCEDPWYNWMPNDDWFCGNAKRREEE